MKTAKFFNFTNQEFIGYWDGKGRKYPAGSSEFMPDYLAKHFAKHLVNRELLSTDSNGNLIYKDGEKMTSPKKPNEAPMFMELFNKAYIPDDTEDIGENKDDLDSLIKSANKNRASKNAEVEAKIEDVKPLSQPRESKPQEDENFVKESGNNESTGPQTIVPPDWNDNDGEEGEFKGKPVEDNPSANK